MLNIGHSHAKYEILRCFLSWTNTFTSIFHDFCSFTSGNLCGLLLTWPKWCCSFFYYVKHTIYSINGVNNNTPILRWSYLQGYRFLTSCNLRWPPFFAKNNRVLINRRTNMYTALSMKSIYLSCIKISWYQVKHHNHINIPYSHTKTCIYAILITKISSAFDKK